MLVRRLHPKITLAIMATPFALVAGVGVYIHWTPWTLMETAWVAVVLLVWIAVASTADHYRR